MKTTLLLTLLFSIQSLAVTLTPVGSGVREKKFLFVGVDVYQATLSVSDPASFVRDTKDNKALDSLKNMKARSLLLKFKRDVSATKILESFEAALKSNNVVESPAMTQFKKAILNGGDVKTGESVTISIDKDKSVLVCEQNAGRVEIKGDDTFFQNVFSIWLGKSADSGLEKLKDKLIKG